MNDQIDLRKDLKLATDSTLLARFCGFARSYHPDFASGRREYHCNLGHGPLDGQCRFHIRRTCCSRYDKNKFGACLVRNPSRMSAFVASQNSQRMAASRPTCRWCLRPERNTEPKQRTFAPSAKRTVAVRTMGWIWFKSGVNLLDARVCHDSEKPA